MAISKNYRRLSSMKKTKAISSNKAANINFKIFGKLKPYSKDIKLYLLHLTKILQITAD